MPRIRTVKPEFFAHEELSTLPADTHLLAAALLCYADDEGYFRANPKLVQAACMPLRESSLSIQEHLRSLAEIGYLRLGVGSDGKAYGHIVCFLRHQRVNRPTPSTISDLEITWERSVNNHGGLNEGALSPQRGKGKEGKGKEGKGERATALPKSLSLTDTMRDYCLRKAPQVDPAEQFEKFCNHHEAKGSTFKSWEAAWRTWCQNAAKWEKPVQQRESLEDAAARTWDHVHNDLAED